MLSLAPLLPPVLAATILSTVIGVLLALAGLGLTIMGGIALADRSVKSGAGALGIGLVFLLLGLWLAGSLPIGG